jgi:enoyl-CoA hydratase/carnithine racemase
VNANRYVFTSEFINSKRAYEMGLVSEVFPTADLHTKVISIAKEITNKPLPALLAAKQAIKENENLTMSEGVALERKIFYPLFDTKGMEEGVKAFVEKRPPNHRDL